MNTDDPDFEADYVGRQRRVDGLRVQHGRGAPALPGRRHRHPAGAGRHRRRIRWSDVEFAFFVILLAVAGNETTRNAMTHGMNAFFENPEQWELFKRERPETAADEIVRWATPVHCFQRTALADTELGGVDDPRGPARRPVLQLRQLRRRGLRAPLPSSTSCVTPTRTWASAATARTSASAPTWPAWRSS